MPHQRPICPPTPHEPKRPYPRLTAHCRTSPRACRKPSHGGVCQSRGLSAGATNECLQGVLRGSCGSRDEPTSKPGISETATTCLVYWREEKAATTSARPRSHAHERDGGMDSLKKASTRALKVGCGAWGAAMAGDGDAPGGDEGLRRRRAGAGAGGERARARTGSSVTFADEPAGGASRRRAPRGERPAARARELAATHAPRAPPVASRRGARDPARMARQRPPRVHPRKAVRKKPQLPCRNPRAGSAEDRAAPASLPDRATHVLIFPVIGA